ncbi:hypothetical protein J31TS6_56820 [Brevibacillus reuszeri]|nr:hypothetical protein J31TS6_56820 [Brevibacillus reuszeri]
MNNFLCYYYTREKASHLTFQPQFLQKDSLEHPYEIKNLARNICILKYDLLDWIYYVCKRRTVYAIFL